MDNKIVSDELITLDDNNTYYIISTINSFGITYGFVNQLDKDDNSLNIYKIIYYDGTNIKVLEDENKINELLPEFSKQVTAITYDYMKYYQESGY